MQRHGSVSKLVCSLLQGTALKFGATLPIRELFLPQAINAQTARLAEPAYGPLTPHTDSVDGIHVSLLPPPLGATRLT